MKTRTRRNTQTEAPRVYKGVMKRGSDRFIEILATRFRERLRKLKQVKKAAAERK